MVPYPAALDLPHALVEWVTMLSMAGVPTEAVSGHVIGEHGDHAVICASSTTVYGRPAHVPAQVREELAARPGRLSAGIGQVRSGPAGATVAALAHVLGITDGVRVVRPWPRRHLPGMPLRFTGGHPTVCLPPLDQAETTDLAAADTKLRAAYLQLTRMLKEVSPA